jgi:hypothetical protein
MSNALEEAVLDRLKQVKSGSSDLSEFQQVCHRLLAYQVLYGEHNNIERDLYYLFKQLEEPIAEYFAVLNFTVFHDARASYVMLFGPGFNGPRIEHSDDAVLTGIKRKLSVEGVCLVLVLRQAYEDALRSGVGFDEQGCASVSVHQINMLYGTLLGRKAPASLERRDTFNEVKALRLILSGKEEWDNQDGWIKITPVINSMAYSQMISGLDESLPHNAAEEGCDTAEEDENSELLSDKTDTDSLFGE